MQVDQKSQVFMVTSRLVFRFVNPPVSIENLGVTMSYSQPLSQANPGCFIFLLDQSDSMSDSWGTTGSREDQVADILNKFLQEIIGECDFGDLIKDRVYLSVIGYGSSVGSAFSGVLAGKDSVKISEINANPIEIQKKTRRESDGAGGIVDAEILFPVWIKPKSGGSTPMTEAFSKALEIVRDWVANHPNSYPPIVINITDGGYDSSPTEVVNKIKELATSDGKALVFNINIENNEKEIFCPDNKNGLSGFGAELYEFSSELPSTMVSMAKEKGNPNMKNGAKGFIYNGDFISLVTFLKFASPIKTR